jgi:nucleoside-diphosphate-sugar epimerase
MASIRNQFNGALVNSLPISDPVDLSGRHIFITGGTGFLGKTLLDYLAECAARHGDFRATVMSRSPDEFLRSAPQYSNLPWLDLCRGQLGSFPTSVRSVTDVIHAAATTHNVSNQVSWIDQIVGGTRSALDWAASVGARRFLLTSSGAVYGQQASGVGGLAEDCCEAPVTTSIASVYGQAKRLAEQLCTIYSAEGRLETIIARCFAFTGPHIPLDGPYAIGNFIRDALARDAIRVRGDGRAIRTYLYGRDIAHWLLTILLVGSNGHAYNVGSDEPVSVAKLAAMVASVVSPGKPVLIESAAVEGEARRRYVPDITKARNIGLDVEVSLEDAIRFSAKADGRN